MGEQFAVAEPWGVIIVVVISFISWIMNTIQAAKKKQEQAAREERRRRQRQQAAGGQGAPGQARGQRQKPDRVKSEIESFLEEVTGQKQQAPPPPQPQAKRPPRRPPARPESKPTPPPQKPRPATPDSLGSGVKRHVSTYMSDRISDHVEHDIADHVETHIGDETITDDFVKIIDENTTATDVRNMLTDTAGVRKAILVNEILQRRTFNR